MKVLGTLKLPVRSAAPGTSSDGDVYFNSTEGAMYVKNASGFQKASSNVVRFSQNVTTSVSSQTVNFPQTFSATPTVTVSLRTTLSTNQIIIPMLTSVTTSAFTVEFSDIIPNSSYFLDVIVAAT